MKIAFLGAGSLGFGRRLASDILSFPELAAATIYLVDPDAERLEFIEATIQRLVQEARREMAAPGAIHRSNEYAAAIIHAVETDTPRCIYANVRNTGLITNLSEGCCVEVPCLINRAGLLPCYVGVLPPQCAALCQTNINMQGLAVRAILGENREAIYHAAMLDPNTTAQLTLPRIRATVDRLLEAQRDLMPSFLQ